jgi:hypothetical protein
MPHHEGRNPPARAAIIAVDVTPTHTAGFHPDEDFPRTGIGLGEVLEFKFAIISENKGFHGISTKKGTSLDINLVFTEPKTTSFDRENHR